MTPFLCLFVILGSLVSSIIADNPIAVELPSCEYDTEIQFYRAIIDVLNLPEACQNDKNLMAVGFIIQDVVWDVEDRLPEYKGEKSHSGVCPFPDQVDEVRRSLGLKTWPPENIHNDRMLQTNRWRYRLQGRCQRCKNQTTARRRLKQQATHVCYVSEQTMILQDQVGYAASASAAILQRMKDTASNQVFRDVDISELLYQAGQRAQECQEESSKAARAGAVVTEICIKASRLRASTESLLTQGKTELDNVMLAAKRAKNALAQLRKVEHDLKKLYYIHSGLSHRELQYRRQRRYGRPDYDSDDSSSQNDVPGSSSSFGIKDLVLVDARRNRDVEGALDCNPVNDCFGSATRFNVRAEVFGNVDRVYLTSEGPIRESGRDEGISPYSVWGDDGNGDYNEMQLPPGTYTMTARATNSQGEKSPLFTKTFTVASANSQSATSQTSSFGVSGLVLVDAHRNKDIDGALDCNPVNDCFGSATKFNIRAEVFGDVDSVVLTSEGPIKASGRTEGKCACGVVRDF